jgi:hypothetical protein
MLARYPQLGTSNEPTPDCLGEIYIPSWHDHYNSHDCRQSSCYCGPLEDSGPSQNQILQIQYLQPAGSTPLAESVDCASG